MKLFINNSLVSKNVYDENKNQICYIKGSLFSWKKYIYNKNKTAVYYTDIVNPNVNYMCKTKDKRYIIFNHNNKLSKIAEVTIDLSNIVKLDGVKRYIMRPSMAGKLNIKSVYGDFIIESNNDGSFVILKDRVIIGKISKNKAFKNRIVECSSVDDAEFLTSLFILSEYMKNEDDSTI